MAIRGGGQLHPVPRRAETLVPGPLPGIPARGSGSVHLAATADSQNAERRHVGLGVFPSGRSWGHPMKILLRLSRLIDATSGLLGRLIPWLVLAAVLISASNAVARKALNLSSNAFLEVQWYLFAAVFLLGAGYVLLENAHVRIDVLAGKLSMRTRNWIDVIGILVFLLPLCGFMITLSWPYVWQAYVSGEISQNYGGLIRWPVYALVPLGFGLLGLQALSELIKRLAFLSGVGPDPLHAGGEEEVSEQGHLGEPAIVGPAPGGGTDAAPALAEGTRGARHQGGSTK